MASKLAGFQYRPMRALGRPASERSDKPAKPEKAATKKPVSVKNHGVETAEPATIAPLTATVAITAKAQFRGDLKRAGLTLVQFAAMTGTPVRTVEEWGRPNGDHQPTGLALSMAKVLASSSDAKTILEADSDGRRSA